MNDLSNRPTSFAAADQPADHPHDTSRRDFIRYGTLAGVGAAIGVSAAGCASTHRNLSTRPAPDFATPPIERLRVGFVGVGGMGSNHVSQFLKCPGVEIRAVCDIVPEKVARIADQVEKAGQPRPTGYSRGPRDFERLCQTEDLDLVFTATPWEWHVPVCVAAMKAGKHAATEVPAAVTLDECWQMVETAEKHHKHCVMMENCCYDRAEMMILNMVRKGVFGEVLHGECGYLHDLRGVKFSADGEGLWRRAHSSRRNGNLYPTHGLGPIANCMDINRGDRFDYLVSMSGPSRGLQLWQKEHLDAADPRRTEQYVLGDVNATLIKTARGRTIYVVHDTNLPRPYSRINMIQGTRGLFMDYPPRFHVEGRSPSHEWEKIDQYAEFEHPLWKSEDVKKASGGHGGMDYLEDYRLIKGLRAGTPLDMDVYDAAALSCICELTERSVANRSRSIDIPDFTRGRWKGRAPLAIVEA
ncbi:MAG: Glycosyl hydrolase family 109 protein 1 [Phycisphaerae bacterium]|nr:Glycosyl hydrolase family 109 protein 1 [Phycisphaerae bacterium]